VATETIKGRLRVRATKGNTLVVVVLPSKKGEAEHQIPEPAKFFRFEDAKDGTEVDVEREGGKIVKVTIPGVTVVPPARGGRPAPAYGGRGGMSRQGGQYEAPRWHAQPRGPEPAAKPDILGLPFHNPYTFVPFPENGPRRNQPTPQTADEVDTARLSGVLVLEVTTISPLKTVQPKPVKESDTKHSFHDALCIDDDVIVPATGVRGALRTLLTVLTGGTLGYLDEGAILCQGRDLNLGPRGPNADSQVPANVFLAEVIKPGNAHRSGMVRLGETVLVKTDDLERKYRAQLPRPKSGQRQGEVWVQIENRRGNFADLTEVGRISSSRTPWRIKLSGRPINERNKHEGAFLPRDAQVELPPQLWREFEERHKQSDMTGELKKGDLLWLAPAQPDLQAMRSADDIHSMQWARWGRLGENLRDLVPSALLPDYLKNDGLVDEITDLFGQADPTGEGLAPNFAARVRPENLVFRGARTALQKKVPLARLSNPHPGCVAFYRSGDPESVKRGDPLKGFKVYRTTSESGLRAPWLFTNQGDFDENGRPVTDPTLVQGTSCDLVSAGQRGRLRITYRALTRRELSLLAMACHVPWRLGGGKPLGLGSCSVRVIVNLDETGAIRDLPDSQKVELEFEQRIELWRQSQRPIEHLRYPRAVKQNNNRIQRGGHVWFARHAMPRKSGSGQLPGLQRLGICGHLRERAGGLNQVSGQVLPDLGTADVNQDRLYGYDGIPGDTEGGANIPDSAGLLESFDPDNPEHIGTDNRSGGSHSPDRESRLRERRDRRE
jgi:hypothetical protein